MGNHEPYRTTYEDAVLRLRESEQEAISSFGGCFKFLCRDRYNLDSKTTILGCTLWSAICPQQEVEIGSRSTDVNAERGIRNWSLEQHCQEHATDLLWLNEQVRTLQNDEPSRQILIATHYSPTVDPRAVDPEHQGSSVSSNFSTSLSSEICWRSPAVRLWAFGHTHYSCSFVDEETGKLILATQNGYAKIGEARRRSEMRNKVVEAGEGVWKVLEPGKGYRAEENAKAVSTTIAQHSPGTVEQGPERSCEETVLQETYAEVLEARRKTGGIKIGL